MYKHLKTALIAVTALMVMIGAASASERVIIHQRIVTMDRYTVVTLHNHNKVIKAAVEKPVVEKAAVENDSYVTIHNNMKRAMISFQAPHIAGQDGLEGEHGINLLDRAIQPGESRTIKIAVGDGYNWCRFHFEAYFKVGDGVENSDFNACERADWWAAVPNNGD